MTEEETRQVFCEFYQKINRATKKRTAQIIEKVAWEIEQSPLLKRAHPNIKTLLLIGCRTTVTYTAAKKGRERLRDKFSGTFALMTQRAKAIILAIQELLTASIYCKKPKDKNSYPPTPAAHIDLALMHYSRSLRMSTAKQRAKHIKLIQNLTKEI